MMFFATVAFIKVVGAKRNKPKRPPWPARIRSLRDPGWTRSEVLDFAGREVVRAAAMLVAWGEPHRAHAFLLRMDELARASRTAP